MIKRWNLRSVGAGPDPFFPGPDTRRLSVAFDPSGFPNATDEELEALGVLRTLDGISALKFVEADRETAVRRLLVTNRPAEVNWPPLDHALSPLDSAQLVGLFLRSVGDYQSCSGRSNTRWLFYWALARGRLPSFWPLFAKALRLGQSAEDDPGALAESVLTRWARGFEARDAIGEQFYRLPSQDAADRMAYHFDYLTLLLLGAMDAMARLTHVALGREGLARSANFRVSLAGGRRFLTWLEHQAHELTAVVSSTAFQVYLELLASLRNSIHGESFRTVAESRRGTLGEEMEHFLIAPRGIHDLMSSLEPAPSWGLKCGLFDMLEPFTLAHALTSTGIALCEQVAAELDRLLPEGTALKQGALGGTIFDGPVTRRLLLLA